MAVESYPAFQEDNSYTAEITRRAIYCMLARNTTLSSAIGSVNGGIVNESAGDLIMSAPVSGMSVNNATGEAIVPGTYTNTQSGYYFRGSSTTNTSVAASNPSNPRIDLVCCTVNDAVYSGSSNNGVIQVLTGTPTSGATLSNLNGAPSLPTSSLLIGYILVPANATSIVSGDLGDHRAQVGMAFAVTAGNGIQVSAPQVGLLGRDATATATAATTYTLPSPQSYNRVIITLTSGDNLTITGWGSPTEGDWLFVDIIQPASGTTTNTVSWTGSTFKCPGGTKPTMSTGASAFDSYAVKYTSSAYHLITIGQAFA